MTIDKAHGEIWYQFAYSIGLVEQGQKLTKEELKLISDKIHDIIGQIDAEVRQGDPQPVQNGGSLEEERLYHAKQCILHTQTYENGKISYGGCLNYIKNELKQFETKVLDEYINRGR